MDNKQYCDVHPEAFPVTKVSFPIDLGHREFSFCHECLLTFQLDATLRCIRGRMLNHIGEGVLMNALLSAQAGKEFDIDNGCIFCGETPCTGCECEYRLSLLVKASDYDFIP